MSLVSPRPVATIDAALAAAVTRRRARTTARDRRNADMLRAMRDVEDYQRQIDADTLTIEDLFEERAASVLRDVATAARLLGVTTS